MQNILAGSNIEELDEWLKDLHVILNRISKSLIRTMGYPVTQLKFKDLCNEFEILV